MVSMKLSSGPHEDPVAAGSAADWASFVEFAKYIWETAVVVGLTIAAIAVTVGAVLKFYIDFIENEGKLLKALVQEKEHELRIRRWVAIALLWLLALFGSRPPKPEGDSPAPAGPTGSPSSGGGSLPPEGKPYELTHRDGTKVPIRIHPGGLDALLAFYRFIAGLIRTFLNSRLARLRASEEPAPELARASVPRRRKLIPLLLVSTCLSGFAVAAPQGLGLRGDLPPNKGDEPVAELSRKILGVEVTGNQRLEPETVLSYTALRIGEPYDQERLDQALRDLYATELFADVVIAGADTGNVVIQVRENPVINRIVLEGNRRLKSDKITPEIRLAPRQIFTRSRARADVARIIELYRRQGRYAASVEPQIVQLDQNRVDVVFEINEGPRSRVRRINIIGNEQFGDGRLRAELEAPGPGLYVFVGEPDTYNPARLAGDQDKLRQFYLSQGYADIRIVSAVAELTPDRRDFIITYEADEGERYRFGKVDVEGGGRGLSRERLDANLPIQTGDWYNAEQVVNAVASLNALAGELGYAFIDVRPRLVRNREASAIDVTFEVQEPRRVFVERIDIAGTAGVADRVIRREFRLTEGDPFNNVRVRRSRDHIQSLGFFQENLEIQQEQGSAPDRVVLGIEVEERATGELQLSAGYSSLERFLINLSIRQRNFLGRGQELREAVNYSGYSKAVEFGFVEPYLFDRNIAVGFNFFRRDHDSFNFLGDTGNQIRGGIALTEPLSLALRYGLVYGEAGLSRDFDDLAGGLRRLRTRLNPAAYWNLTNDFIFSTGLDGGYIHSFEDGRAAVPDRLVFAGAREAIAMPAILTASTTSQRISEEAIGGRAYYLARPELEIPLGAGVRELGLGLPGSAVGALWGLAQSDGIEVNNALGIDDGTGAVGTNRLRYSASQTEETIVSDAITPFRETFLGNSQSPGVEVGIGVNWNSPFGPFRIDIARALLSETDENSSVNNLIWTYRVRA